MSDPQECCEGSTFVDVGIIVELHKTVPNCNI